MSVAMLFVIDKNKTAQMFISMWKNKQTVVSTNNRILLNDKNKWTIDTHINLDESQNNYTEISWTKKEYILYDSIDIKF